MNSDVERIASTLEDEELVVFAVLFGSLSKGTHDNASDVDVAVKFASEPGLGEVGRLSLELSSVSTRSVDVVDVETTKPHIAYKAVMHGDLLCGDTASFKQFKERINEEFDREEHRAKKQEFVNRVAEGDFDV